jgi:hypothetical protein
MMSRSAVGMSLGPVRSRLPRCARRIVGVGIDRRLGRPGCIGAGQPRALPHLHKRIGFVGPLGQQCIPERPPARGFIPVGHPHCLIVRSSVDRGQVANFGGGLQTFVVTAPTCCQRELDGSSVRKASALIYGRRMSRWLLTV